MPKINEFMLEALQNATEKLSPEANELIKNFVLSQLNPDGGFNDKSGRQDIYYSVFGYSLALVYKIDFDIEKHKAYLKSRMNIEELDLVHAVSLIRAYILLEAISFQSSLPKFAPNLSKVELFRTIATKKIFKSVKDECAVCFDLIEEYKSDDGGYNQNGKAMKHGTVYAAFLIWSLMQDLDTHDFTFLNKLHDYSLADGSYVNELQSKSGITSSTAAGLILSLETDSYNTNTLDWLSKMMNRHGGFLASEGAPIADVLSTATALTALKMAGANMSNYTNALEFVNLHWDETGGFFGSLADMKPDVEYTFYAVLTIGLI